MEQNKAGCIHHLELAAKVEKLELEMNDVQLDVKDMKRDLQDNAIVGAKLTQSIDLLIQSQNTMQKEVTGLRTDMLKLVTDTLNKSRDDMSNLVKIQEKNEEKDREHKRYLELQEQKNVEKARIGERAFYRKFIIGCLVVGSTIILAAFGIKAIIPIF